jgi:peptidoglycan/LPS O-acetylase OafA/YrhL
VVRTFVGALLTIRAVKVPSDSAQRALRIQSLGPRAVTPSQLTLDWLNALKGIAILAVVLDHAFIVDNYLLWKHLYFSVSWFIFLTGVSNTHSALRCGFRPLRDALSLWRRRLGTLLPAYLAASALAFVFLYAGHVSATSFLRELLLFHSLPPLYFIALLLQLLAIFPVLFLLLYRSGWLGRLTVAAVIIPVAAVLSHAITFPWVLGAHYLFGASFLYLFVLGMALAPLLAADRPRPLVVLACSLPLLACAEAINLATDGELMTHPPSNLLVVYSLALLGLAYALCRLFAGSAVVRFFSLLGCRSLDIFVYHYLWIAPFLHFRQIPWTDRLPYAWGQVVLMVAAVPLAIAGSLLTARMVELFFREAKRLLSALLGPWERGRLPRPYAPEGRVRVRARPARTGVLQ